MLQNIEFDQAILTDIVNQPVQVPESILAHATVLSDEEGAAALKLRKKIMRKGYNPVDRNECDSEEEDALPDDDAQECLDPTADPPDPADDEGIKAAEAGPSNESPPARSDDPTSPGTPPRQDSDKEDEDWLPDIPDVGFPMSLSMEDTILDMDDLRQYAAIKFLQQADQPRGDENTDNEAGATSSDVSSDGSDDEPQPPAWTQNPETQAEQIAIERGQKLVMMFENTPLCDIDPAWFILSFPDYCPNGRGLPPKGWSFAYCLAEVLDSN